MGFLTTKYSAALADAEIRRAFAAADAQEEAEFRRDLQKIEQKEKHEEHHMDLALNGISKNKCSVCGRESASKPMPVRVVDDKLREKDAEIDLKVNPPDLKQRFKDEPLYLRIKRRDAAEGIGEGLPEDNNVIDNLIEGAGALGVKAAGKGFDLAKGAVGRVGSTALAKGVQEGVQKKVKQARNYEESGEQGVRQLVRAGGAFGVGGISPADRERLQREEAERRASIATEAVFAGGPTLQYRKENRVTPSASVEKVTKQSGKDPLVKKLFG